MSAPPLDTFLVGAKEALQSARNNKSEITLVLGKDRPDLDSIASAVVFAYFRTAQPPQNAWSPFYIPALNERRADLSHQALLMRVLPHASITLEDLVAVEDLVTQGTQSGLHEDITRFFFVDHNITLGREKQNYSQKVIGCIDHTVDVGYVPQNTDPEPRIIAKAGSCTSLVVNYSRRSWESVKFETQAVDVSMAKLALAAILVDTKDLNSGVTEEDINAVEFLLSRINYANNGQDFDRTGYYYEIIGEERPQPRMQFGPEPPPPQPIPQPVITEPVFVETRTVEQVQPVVYEEPIVEPPRAIPIEPVVEAQPEVIPERTYVPEPVPEPIPEPAPIESVFIETSPVAQAQPEAYEEPIPEAQPIRDAEPVAEEPIEEEPTNHIAPVRSSFPRVYLSDVLAHDFELGHEGGGAIGISFTPMGLAEMVLHAERDLIERAIEEATNGVHNGEAISDDHVMRGTPFTAAVREFALERGLAVYAIRTNIRKGNELFIWVFEPSMAYFIPRFVQNRARELGLERWGTDEDKITREAGMNTGMMGAYWMRSDTGREGVKKAVMEGTTYIFFGNGNGPASPRSAPKRGFSGSFVATQTQ